MENKRKILLIDDSPTIVKMLEIILEEEGFEAVSANDGISGIKIAEDEKPDLIILDIMLPGMDGYEVCEKIKINQDTKNIPVIMLTGKDMGDDFDKAMEKKADWYIVKPYDAAHLLKVINKLIDK